MKKWIFSVVALFLFYGCGTSINLSEYRKIPISKSPLAPSKQELKREKIPNVLIQEFDNTTSKVARRASLDKNLPKVLENRLAESKLVHILNRDKKFSLREEIKAKELAMETGTDVGQADYIINGYITNASFTNNYVEGKTYTVGDKTITLPPKYEYRACVSGVVKILELPDMKVADTTQFEGCATDSENLTIFKKPKIQDNGLVIEAGENGIDSASYEIKNFFAIRGYIFEMRKNKDGDTILNTTLGKSRGAEEGLKVDIFKLQKHTNPLTEETSIDEVKIGEGVISNQIENSSSWVIVKELESNSKIEIGDFVKPHYKESLISRTLKMAGRI